MAALLISTLEDQSVQYSVDGQFIVETDHVTDGDVVMDKIDSAMRNIAELLMLDIIEEEVGTLEDIEELD